MDVVLENFMEELGGERTHVDIMLQFLEEAGISRDQADQADLAPGTMAAIEMIVGGCQRRSALEGLALLSFVEEQHGGVNGCAAAAYRELTGHYRFSPRRAPPRAPRPLPLPPPRRRDVSHPRRTRRRPRRPPDRSSSSVRY